MARQVLVPIKVVNKAEWGDLSVLGLAHEIVGETVKEKNPKFSFAGGHRVRLYYFKKNVHWRISGAEFDIAEIAPVRPPRKKL